MTSSTSQASTSSNTTSSAACITTSPSNSTEGQNLVAWFGAYSSLTIGFVGTKNGSPENLNFTYTVVSKSTTTYEVNLNLILNGKSRTYTLWDFTNGTVLALLPPSGVNYTGSTASNIVLGFFSGLETLNTIALQSTNTAYFHATGTSTVTIGTNSFTVTNYALNTTPETIQGCSNSGSADLNSYSVSMGTPSGSSFELVVSATFAGAFATVSGNSTVDYTYQLTALSVA